MNVLVTGGIGYIGSHTVVELLENKYNVVVIDNFSNSKPEVIDAIKQITKKSFQFYEGNVCDKQIIEKIFINEKIDAVIHFAGYKAVGESVEKPLTYYRNNIDSTLTLLETMKKYNCKKIVFSSSATVYGNAEKSPITEENLLSTTNPYGTTKLIIEGILNDLYKSDSSWSIAKLRYFNPIGAHKSGLIGENPNDIPNNLMPYIVKVAIGELDHLNIFGNDYNTIDGTGVRDYIHIVDLAKGHIKAIEYINDNSCCEAYNLGTGNGTSVLELVNTFSKVNNIKINYCITSRRSGDIDSCYANSSKAEKILKWKAINKIDDMCKDSYNYALSQKNRR